ncbi:TPA: entry exclusion protein 1 [Yersinia enterocolitica]
MAWHSVNQAQKLVQKSRRTLYRDMASGRLSWRSNVNGTREIETTELIRVYGELSLPDTHHSHMVSHDNGTGLNSELLAEVRALRAEVAELKQSLLRIEFTPISKQEQHLNPNKKRWWNIFWD